MCLKLYLGIISSFLAHQNRFLQMNIFMMDMPCWFQEMGVIQGELASIKVNSIYIKERMLVF